MKKNLIEKYGEKVRKRKEANDKIIEKYWKLPAAERLHYDSIERDINYSLPKVLGVSFSILKMTVLLPLFLMFIGLMTGTIDKMVIISSTLIVTFMKILPAVFMLDLLLSYLGSTQRKNRLEELDRRFKLTK